MDSLAGQILKKKKEVNVGFCKWLWLFLITYCDHSKSFCPIGEIHNEREILLLALRSL
jgi:hypothetical protein